MEEDLKNFIQTFINNFKGLKKRNKIIIITIIISIIMYFVPVKFAVKLDDIDKNKEYYILEFIDGYTTDSGWYIVDGWDNKPHTVYHVKGKVPSDYLTNSISREYDNRYVVYGSLECLPNDTILTIERWNVLSGIHGGKHKKYLTIYDLNWLPWLSEKNEPWRADNINEQHT